MRVDVCVITYRRPHGLKRLLGGLNKLAFQKCQIPDLEIVVVDNDTNGAASELCKARGSKNRWPLRYVLEPRRGISFARNKAVKSARQDADFITFIDDDEVPEPYWLDELLAVQNDYKADVVAGPVLPYFGEEVPEWIIKGGFFDRPRLPTGTVLDLVRTGNVLIKLNLLHTMGKLFDERFALTGGEDTHFFKRVNLAGYRMVWADGALVYEWVPKTRANTKWLLKRSYRTGITLSRVELYVEPSPRTFTVRFIKGVGRVGQGLLMIPVTAITGRQAAVKALQHMASGYGMLAGLAGRQYEEYRETHSV